MGTRVWTPAQQVAIAANEGRYLVSAGAGSGKTAVLTERIKRLVLEKGVPLSSLLVLTFTNKAAHEMKGRVRDAFLASDVQRLDLAEQVENSAITTFDAFALKIVKKYHYSLGLDGDIALLSEDDFGLEKKKLLAEILDEHYADKDPQFLDFVHHYAFKDDDAIVKMTLTLFEKAELSGDKKAFYAQAMSMYFSDEFLESQYQEFGDYLHAKLLTMKQLCAQYENSDFADDGVAFLEPFLALHDYDAFYQQLAEAKFPSLPRKGDGKSDFDKAIHSSLNGSFNVLKDTVLVNGTKADSLSRLLALRPYAQLWLNLAQELDERLSAYKRRYGVYTFADIAAYAREAALNPALQKEMRQTYRYLMVDEFQDTSDLQFGFLSALDSGNFFAVGDIKQAIYRFRHANPTLFLETKERFEKGGGQVIILQDNFRSREEVITGINDLFSHLMSKDLGDVTYDQSQVLGYGNKAAYSASSSPIYRFETYVYERRQGHSIADEEARLIVGDILAKLNSHFPIYDETLKATRPCRMADFAILISRKRDFPLYQQLCGEAKLSISVSNDQDLSSQDVSLVMESFLRLGLAIDQSEVSEKHCYASIMRSYLYQEKDPAIYQDLQSGAYRHSPLFETIRSALPFLRKASSFEAVRFYLDHFPFYSRLVYLGDVVANYEKLASFLTAARARDRLGGSYQDFIAYFDDLKTYDETFKLPEPQDDGDSIKLMSIHASKGLEFPVVYCPDLGAGVQKAKFAPSFNFSFEHGFIFPATLGEGSPDSVLQSLVAYDEERAALSEKMRLYYVALTRAKEKVILLERKRENLTVYPIDSSHILKIRNKVAPDGSSKMTSSLATPTSFHEFNDLAPHFAFGRSEKSVPTTLVPYASPGAVSSPRSLPSYHQIAFEAQEILPQRASKQSLEPLDEGALLRGDVLHRYLEVADFRSKDVSYIKDPADRLTIEKVLALPLFARTADATFLPEDAFYDQENDIHGAIDLLILYPEKAVVVDYKTKEIDDPAYPKQLAVYRSYVSKTYQRPCETYLLSILGAYLKEVK